MIIHFIVWQSSLKRKMKLRKERNLQIGNVSFYILYVSRGIFMKKIRKIKKILKSKPTLEGGLTSIGSTW